jgi:rare lipoprotein A
MACLIMAGCSMGSRDGDSGPDSPPDLSRVREAKPRAEPPSRSGNAAVYRVLGRSYRTLPTSAGYRERGEASWYGTKFHGRTTSSGERYDMYAMTAAHKSLPLPTYARVTHRDTGKSVVVRVNDRGPFHDGRIIDLSYAAAVKLGMHKQGVAPVEVEALPPYQSLSGRVRQTLGRTDRPFYLQVGAFRDLDNAQRLQQRLNASLDHPIHIDSGGRVHRVRIGPLRDPDQISGLTPRLIGFGVHDTHIVFD